MAAQEITIVQLLCRAEGLIPSPARMRGRLVIPALLLRLIQRIPEAHLVGALLHRLLRHRFDESTKRIFSRHTDGTLSDSGQQGLGRVQNKLVIARQCGGLEQVRLRGDHRVDPLIRRAQHLHTVLVAPTLCTTESVFNVILAPVSACGGADQRMRGGNKGLQRRGRDFARSDLHGLFRQLAASGGDNQR